MGKEGKVFMTNNKILFNEPYGIKIGISMNVFLIWNKISHN